MNINTKKSDAGLLKDRLIALIRSHGLSVKPTTSSSVGKINFLRQWPHIIGHWPDIKTSNTFPLTPHGREFFLRSLIVPIIFITLAPRYHKDHLPAQKVRRDLAQRTHHEFPFFHSGMRDDKLRCVDQKIIIQKNINVNCAGTAWDSPHTTKASLDL